MADIEQSENRRIKIFFSPYGFEAKTHAVEKDMNGKKRRYLKGVSSGVHVDGHGEMMTPNCIKSFQSQAESGDILLYEGLHGVNFIDDIGRLEKSEILPNGDWLTEYRLYDDGDGMGQTTTEKADKLWKQVNGLPPYKYPRQKGFSIEGEIPKTGVVQMNESGKRVMDDVKLDGVVVVPRPAYLSSVAQAVYKALGINPPYLIRKNLTVSLKDIVDESEKKEIYFKRKWQIEEALECEVKEIMLSGEQIDERLNMLFDEYRNLMIDLILSSAEMFKADAPLGDVPAVLEAAGSIGTLINKLNAELRVLQGV
jgi:hypothetical protein